MGSAPSPTVTHCPRAFVFAKLLESPSSRPRREALHLRAPIQSAVCNCEAPASLPPSTALPTPAAEAGSQALLCTPNPGPAPAPFVELRGGWRPATGLPAPSEPSSQLTPAFRVLTLFSPAGAPQIRKVKWNSAFALSWRSVAGAGLDLGREASWRERRTSRNHEMTRPGGNSQEFRVHSHYSDLCRLLWASSLPGHLLFPLIPTIRP